MDTRAYIKQLEARLAVAEGQAAALQDILTAARLVLGESADGNDAVAHLGVPHGQVGNERMQVLVDAVRAYDRRAQP